MQTYLWDPWSILDELERSMFETGSSEWPQFDIEDSDDETVLAADLPGMGEDDIDVTVCGPYLVVRGERKAKEGPREHERASYHRRERAEGTFNRTVTLPALVDADRVEARYADGILTLVLPKAAEAKPRQIVVKT